MENGMRGIGFHRALIALVLVAIAAVRCASAEQPAADFPGFWTQFRRAVLADDMPRVMSMARLPVEVRGPMDGDPVEHLGKEQFPAAFHRLLEQDAGMRPEPETLRAYVQRRAAERAAAGTARVANLAFEQVDGRWWLVRMYRAE
jgi:hypothetical protein